MWLLWLVMRNILEYLNKCKDDKKNFLKEGKICYWLKYSFTYCSKIFLKSPYFWWKQKTHLSTSIFFTASLGDLITLSLLSWIASLLFADIEEDRWLSTTIIATYVLFTPVCIYFAKKHASTIGKQTVDFT